MLRFSGNGNMGAGQVIVLGFDGPNTAFDFLETIEAISGLMLRRGSLSVVSRDLDGQLAFVRYGERFIEGVVGGSISSCAAQLLINVLSGPECHLRATPTAKVMDRDLHTIGIDGDFCRQLYQLLSCNSSAICLLVWDELSGCNLGASLLSHVRLIQKTLSVFDEFDLRRRLGGI